MNRTTPYFPAGRRHAAAAAFAALTLTGALAGTAALADTTVERSFALAADGELEISNVQGRIDVRGWDDAAVRLVARMEGDPESLQISQDGRRARIKVEVEEGWFGRDRRDEDTDMTLDVPRGVSLRISAVSADVSVRDHAGEQRIQSVSGDIDIDGTSADADVESISGDVDFRGNGATGRYNVSAVSGDAQVSDVSGEVRVSSISGDARVRGLTLTDVKLETVSGDVDMHGRLLPRARLRANSVSGEVELHLCDRADVSFDLESFSGDIRDRVSGRRPDDDGFGPGAKLRFSEGDGSIRVRVNTMSGSIDIRPCD